MNPYRTAPMPESVTVPTKACRRSFFNLEDLVGNLAWFSLGPVFLLISIGAAIHFATSDACCIDLKTRLTWASTFLPFILLTGWHTLTVIRAFKNHLTYPLTHQPPPVIRLGPAFFIQKSLVYDEAHRGA